jgi:hypothetical protein
MKLQIVGCRDVEVSPRAKAVSAAVFSLEDPSKIAAYLDDNFKDDFYEVSWGSAFDY